MRCFLLLCIKASVNEILILAGLILNQNDVESKILNHENKVKNTLHFYCRVATNECPSKNYSVDSITTDFFRKTMMEK